MIRRIDRKLEPALRVSTGSGRTYCVVLEAMAVVPALSLPRLALPPRWFVRLRARLGRVRLAVWEAAGEPAEVDADTLALARSGDPQAFARIVDCYDGRMRALAYRLLNDRDRMDDALQEAYLKAFRALPRFKGDARLGTWLYRIVHNACLDELRRKSVVVPLHRDYEESSDEREPASPRPGPDDVATGRADLAAALASIPTDQRAAVFLVDAYGLDYDEAAEVLGVRAGTIGSRLSRARAALRAALKDEA